MGNTCYENIITGFGFVCIGKLVLTCSNESEQDLFWAAEKDGASASLLWTSIRRGQVCMEEGWQQWQLKELQVWKQQSYFNKP